ncbi:heparinase II/III domain-containing protein [Campylobacter devanensis]|uniref:heparinase II/III domain-containing protein n=2 Tax=Campylobacter devanensis TaxID=3161138 RepID=UPI000A32CBD7|nr:heparinase II/III family protein [Campylobacter sp. P0021]
MNHNILRIFYPEIFSNLKKSSLKDNLDKLKNNILKGDKRRNLDDLKIINESDWERTNTLPDSAAWHFHTLGRPLSSNLYEKIRSDESIDLVVKHVKMWINWDKNSKIKHEQVYSGHTVALRLEFLLLVYIFKQDSLILKTIQEHIDFLKQNYDGDWNHGLDQSIALLKAAYFFNLSAIKELAIQRIYSNFNQTFDEEGVCQEQAISYHHYNIYRFWHVMKIFKFINENYKIFENKLNLANNFLLWAILPNGYYCNLGDTIYEKPSFDIFTKEQKALIKQNSSLINELFYPSVNGGAIFKAGYIFMRSNWGGVMNNSSPRHLSTRFGSARIIHGHNDHMSITYFDGKPLIVDGGFSGYSDDAFRNFVRSPLAHNVVFIENHPKFKWNSETFLKEYKTYENNAYFTLEDTPYDGVIRKRSVFSNIDNATLVIQDTIISDREFTYTQNFNIDDDILLNNNGDITLNCGYILKNIINKNDKLEISKVRMQYNGDKVNILGGYACNVPNNKEIYNVRTYKTGKKVDFLSIFSKNKIDLIDNNLIICDNTLFDIANKAQYKINSLNTTSKTIINDKNKKSFIEIDLPLEQYLLLYIECESDGYFYIKPSDKIKYRFNKYYILKDKNQLEFVLLENQKIDIKINISNLEYLEYKEK